MNSPDDTILNSDEIYVLQELLDKSEVILGTEHATTIANTKKKLSLLTDVYHIMHDSRFDAARRSVSVRFTLESAITQKRVVTFMYSRYNTTHTVEPYKIVHVSGVSYLVAGQHGRFNKRIKKYCLDFVEDLEVTDKCFVTIPLAMTMSLAVAKTIWFSEKPPVKVFVEFDQRVAHFFRREQFFPSQEIIEENDDGSIVVSIEASNRMDFFLQAARWMPNFRVIHPPEFRQLIFERAQQTLERNKPLLVSLKGYQSHGVAYNSIRNILRPLGRLYSPFRTSKGPKRKP